MGQVYRIHEPLQRHIGWSVDFLRYIQRAQAERLTVNKPFDP